MRVSPDRGQDERLDQRAEGVECIVRFIGPYVRAGTQTLADIRDDLRLKKLLKRAVEREVASYSLIESIRTRISA